MEKKHLKMEAKKVFPEYEIFAVKIVEQTHFGKELGVNLNSFTTEEGSIIYSSLNVTIGMFNGKDLYVCAEPIEDMEQPPVFLVDEQALDLLINMVEEYNTYFSGKVEETEDKTDVITIE